MTMSSDPTPTDPIERARDLLWQQLQDTAATQTDLPDDVYWLNLAAASAQALSAAGLLAVTPAQPVGYVIAGPDDDGHMECDWDGKVHESRRDADEELVRCRVAYEDWRLYALIPVDPSSPAPADDEAAQVERITRSALASETQAMASIAKAVGLAEDDDAEAIVYQVRELVAALAALKGKQT
jgi:hypothetical protein